MTQEPTAASTIVRVESRLGSLHVDALLNSQRDRLGQVDAQLAQLPQQVAQVRSRGYLYQARLEEQIALVAKRWPEAHRQALVALEEQVALLRPEINRADEAVRRLQPLKGRPLSTAQPTIQRVEDELSAVERRIRAAQQAVEGVYSALAREVQAIGREVQTCERMLDWLAGASFTTDPGEWLVAATEAQQVDDKERTEGVLFLTDQRLIFERREKVARKKILFITTASEVERELTWQAALDALERVEASEARKAVVSKRELLAVAPRSGSRARAATFELKTDSDAWRALVLRCQTGEIGTERVDGAPEIPEYLVPAKCPSCGGALTQAGRIRGVGAIRCDYCGAAVVLERAPSAKSEVAP